MQKILRNLRIAFSTACFVACLLLIAAWIRSYSWDDSICGPWNGGQQTLAVSSDGQLFAGVWSGNGALWKWFSMPTPFRHPPGTPFNCRGFGIGRTSNACGLVVPYYFAVILFLVLAAVSWPLWSIRFSLRTLLIAMTLVAATLGFSVCLIR